MKKNDKSNKGERKKNINTVIAPLTPKTLGQEIKANTQLRYGDQMRDYGKQLGASRQQSRQINQWYGQYRNSVKDIQKGQAGATAALQDQARAWDKTAASRAATEAGRVSGEEDRSAAIRGALPDTSGQAQTDQYAEDQRNALRKSYGMRAAEMGTASNNLLGQFREASWSGLRDDQRRERNIRLNIQKDRNAAQKEKGAFRVSERGRLRGEERDWNYQNRALNADISFNKASLAQKDRYSDAMITQAQLGLAGKKASAAATLGAAKLYSGAKIKSAALYNAGGGKKVKGADVLRARDYLTAELRRDGSGWKAVESNPGQWIAKLTDRGADPIAARVAVRRLIRLNTQGPKPGSKAWADEKNKRSGRK